MMLHTRIHVTKARPSSLEADIISPAQPKVLPGGTVPVQDLRCPDTPLIQELTCSVTVPEYI